MGRLSEVGHLHSGHGIFPVGPRRTYLKYIVLNIDRTNLFEHEHRFDVIRYVLAHHASRANEGDYQANESDFSTCSIVCDAETPDT